MKGILEHKYVDASDDPAVYSADQCKRQAVTVEWAYEHLCDVTLYVWTGAETDPWLTIEGVDKLIKGSYEGDYILEHGRIGEMTVDGSFRVFASRSTVFRVENELEHKFYDSVVTCLGKMGIIAYVEYPLYISVGKRSYGTVNGPWGWNDEEGNGGRLSVPDDGSAKLVAAAIAGNEASHA